MRRTFRLLDLDGLVVGVVVVDVEYITIVCLVTDCRTVLPLWRCYIHTYITICIARCVDSTEHMSNQFTVPQTNTPSSTTHLVIIKA